MTTLREVLVAALKSLLRGKSFLQAFFAFWVSPTVLKGSDHHDHHDAAAAAAASKPRRSPRDFLKEAEHLFLQPIQGDGLAQFATRLKAQFQHGLLTNPACMLPSYNHQLPNRSEHGQYLALDVGGSTLRVALVELRGKEARGNESRIARLDSFKIDQSVKNLAGTAFFAWMAQRIVDTIARDVGAENAPGHPLLMGLAWSFPIEQTSLKGGKLQGMGKGFLASNGLEGQDLGALIKAACAAQGLHVELAAIVNDSTAALLAEAYRSAATRFGLILGTGVNIAVHLPVAAVGRAKYGDRPGAWFEKASHVVVNTELGMFGGGILPVTRWDQRLNAAHPKPDFQPLEHLVSGFYLGELCRLALVEAVDAAGVLGGVVPPSLLLPYSLDTETISCIEADSSPSLTSSRALFHARHPSPTEPTHQDIAFIRNLASFISRRSSAIVAASLFALWDLKREAEARYSHHHHHLPLDKNTDNHNNHNNNLKPEATARREDEEDEDEAELDQHVVAFNGSVIEQYPGYLENCQGYIDELLASGGGGGGGKPGTTMRLVGAKESSLLGAAVALACLEEGKAN